MTFYCPTCKEDIPDADVDFNDGQPRHPVEGELVGEIWNQRWHDVEETEPESALDYEIRRERAVDDEVDRRREAREEESRR